MSDATVPEEFAEAFRDIGNQSLRDPVEDAIEWLKELAQPRDGVNPEIILLVHHDHENGKWWINSLTFERAAWHLQLALAEMYSGNWND